MLLLGVEKNECAALRRIQINFLIIIYLINIIIFNFSIYKCLMKKKVVPKLRQEVKVKVDIITRYIIKGIKSHSTIISSFCGICRRQCHYEFNWLF